MPATRSSRGPVVVMALLDVLALLAFVVAGVRSHGETAVAEHFLRNAVPLVVSWIAFAIVLGTYRRPGFATLWRTWLVAVPIALVVRTVWVGSPTGVGLPDVPGRRDRVHRVVPVDRPGRGARHGTRVSRAAAGVRSTSRCPTRSARAATGSTRRWRPTRARRVRRSPASPADVCIVGGGFAGLWTAYELTEREPGCAIALLEPDICGGGGSGANGGFFSSSWWTSPASSAGASATRPACAARRVLARPGGRARSLVRRHAGATIGSTTRASSTARPATWQEGSGRDRAADARSTPRPG